MTFVRFLNRPLFLILVPLYAWASAGDPPTNYDEVRNADGSLRLHYQGISEIYEKISPTRQRELLRQSKVHFDGDNQLNLLPRVLTENEMESVRAGVTQRAHALKLFFEDHYSGKKTYLKQKILPREFVDQIIARHGEQSWEGKIPKEALSWLYGPDIVRLPNGTFAIVEDNFGYIGGLGDLVKAPETLFKLVPEYNRYLEIPNPKAFYQRLANRYKDRAEKNGGKVVLLTYTASDLDDNESYRLFDIMDEFGVETVQFDSYKSPDARTAKYLEVKPDGVYLRKKVGGRMKSEKVGFVFIQGHPSDIDSSSPYSRRVRIIKAIDNYLNWTGKKADPRVVKLMRENALGRPFMIEEAESLFSEPKFKTYYDLYLNYGKGGVPGLYDAVMTGKVGANYAPGMSFAEDKEFYTAVPDLIRHYLKQEPLIQNLETASFRKFVKGKAIFDESTFDHVFAHIEDYVIKGVAGMGGAEVWIGRKLTAEGIATLKETIRQSPSLFILQSYQSLSVMNGDLVDLRLIADVGPIAGDVVTAPYPWGRASPMKGSGKVNISSGGSETAVFVRKTASLDCKSLVNPL